MGCHGVVVVDGEVEEQLVGGRWELRYEMLLTEKM